MRKCCKSQLKNDRHTGTETSPAGWIVPPLPLQALSEDPLHLNWIPLYGT